MEREKGREKYTQRYLPRTGSLPQVSTAGHTQERGTPSGSPVSPALSTQEGGGGAKEDRQGCKHTDHHEPSPHPWEVTPHPWVWSTARPAAMQAQPSYPAHTGILKLPPSHTHMVAQGRTVPHVGPQQLCHPAVWLCMPPACGQSTPLHKARLLLPRCPPGPQLLPRGACPVPHCPSGRCIPHIQPEPCRLHLAPGATLVQRFPDANFIPQGSQKGTESMILMWPFQPCFNAPTPVGQQASPCSKLAVSTDFSSFSLLSNVPIK